MELQRAVCRVCVLMFQGGSLFALPFTVGARGRPPPAVYSTVRRNEAKVDKEKLSVLFFFPPPFRSFLDDETTLESEPLSTEMQPAARKRSLARLEDRRIRGTSSALMMDWDADVAVR